MTACFITCISMALGNMPPLLFLTFREEYGLSYTALGLLVLVNFCTQLTLDLIFSFFSHKFDLVRTVKVTPFIMSVGLIVFAVMPIIDSSHPYIWLVAGMMIYAAGGGLAEVLVSPTVASLPSKNPERTMSALHSVFAWGVVFVVCFTTIFIKLAGTGLWFVAVLLLALLPLSAGLVFAGAKFKAPETQKSASGVIGLFKQKALLLGIIVIFCGGAGECVMSQWSSSYLEMALGIPKVVGDICGVALFGVMLGLGRSLYAAIGKNIIRVITVGSIICGICYIITALSGIAWIGLIASALTGFFISMAWPGTLIAAQDRIDGGGVAMFAILAAGGDLGAAVCPQMLGIIADVVSLSDGGVAFAAKTGMTPDQLGMRAGLLIASVIPLIGAAAAIMLGKIKKTGEAAGSGKDTL